MVRRSIHPSANEGEFALLIDRGLVLFIFILERGDIGGWPSRFRVVFLGVLGYREAIKLH